MTTAALQNTAKPSSTNPEDQMLKFLDLSQDILSLVRHENAILLEKGELSFEAYVMRKVALMTDFEKEARKLLGSISGRDNKMSTQIMLVEEIRRVRDALKVNSGYQLETIRARMREKIAAPEDNSEDNSMFASAQEEGTLCH